MSTDVEIEERFDDCLPWPGGKRFRSFPHSGIEVAPAFCNVCKWELSPLSLPGHLRHGTVFSVTRLQWVLPVPRPRRPTPHFYIINLPERSHFVLLVPAGFHFLF